MVFTTASLARSVTIAERTYKGWRAAALTFGFLSLGLLTWGLVLNGYVNKLEHTSNQYSTIQSSFTRERPKSDAAPDLQIIDTFLPAYSTILETAEQGRFTAHNTEIRQFCKRIAHDREPEADLLRSIRRQISVE